MSSCYLLLTLVSVISILLGLVLGLSLSTWLQHMAVQSILNSWKDWALYLQDEELQLRQKLWQHEHPGKEMPEGLRRKTDG